MGKTFGTQDDQGSVLEEFVKRTKLTGVDHERFVSPIGRPITRSGRYGPVELSGGRQHLRCQMFGYVLDFLLRDSHRSRVHSDYCESFRDRPRDCVRSTR